jgi:hypothetical protein
MAPLVVELPLDSTLDLDSSQTDSDISQLSLEIRGICPQDFLNRSMLPQSGPQSVAVLPAKRKGALALPCKWLGER